MTVICISVISIGFDPPAPVISVRYHKPNNAGSWRASVVAGRVVVEGYVAGGAGVGTDVAGDWTGWLMQPAANMDVKTMAMTKNKMHFIDKHVTAPCP
jgi:hypothetical protein